MAPHPEVGRRGPAASVPDRVGIQRPAHFPLVRAAENLHVVEEAVAVDIDDVLNLPLIYILHSHQFGGGAPLRLVVRLCRVSAAWYR